MPGNHPAPGFLDAGGQGGDHSETGYYNAAHARLSFLYENAAAG
jgi:hypothetical protein